MSQIKIILLVFTTIITGHSFGQQRNLSYTAEIGGAIPTNHLPFWLYSNTYGKISSDTYLWGNIGLFSHFKKENTRSLDYSIGFEGTGFLGKENNNLIMNQIYGRVRWQNLTLDLGMLNREIIYDGLSATNGDMLYSTNSRSMPGISLSTWNYIKFPWLGRWLSFKARYAEYVMNDTRYMKHARLHNKLLAGKLTITPQLSIEGGIEDYAQWGGKDPVLGEAAGSFKDYVRMVMIKGGGSEATESDKINKMGNHIGMHFAKIRYSGKVLDTEVYYNHMFEDGSGMEYQNWPDGLYGIYITRKNKSKWFKSFLYELYYTKNQSGPLHDRPATPEEIEQNNPNDPYQTRVVLGGNDNYFNHGEYKSGWTYYGRTIGVPFFTPNEANADDITYGIYNSRFIAHHIGICGDLPLDIRYKLRFSYSRNYGTHSQPFFNEQGKQIAKSQYSFGAEFIAPDFNLPFNTSLNLGFDKGDLLKNNWGIMIKIFRTGFF